MDVVIVLQSVDKVVDFGQLFLGERLGIAGDSFEAGFGDFDAHFFHDGGEGAEGLVFAVNEAHVAFDFHFLQSGIHEFEFEFFKVHPGGVEFDDALAVEHEFERAGVDKFAAVLVEGGADVGEGTVGVLGGTFHEDEAAVGAFALVVDLGDVANVLTGSAFDRFVDVVLGHVLRLGVQDGGAEGGVGIRVRPSGFRGHRDGGGEFRENARHFPPTFLFGASSNFKCSSHSGVTCWGKVGRAGEILNPKVRGVAALKFSVGSSQLAGLRQGLWAAWVRRIIWFRAEND